MTLRPPKIVIGLVFLGLIATGCSANLVSATPTPVDYKACISASPSGINDGGLNQNAYFGLQQSEAQFGVAISAVNAPVSPSIGLYQRAIQRLINRGCKLIFAVGGNQNAAVYSKSSANPAVNFVLVDQPSYSLRTASRDSSLANVQAINFDSKIAAFQAGYLAASTSKSSVIGVISATGDQIAQQEVWYFRQGVSYFNAANPANQVVVIGSAADDTSAAWTIPEGTRPAKVKNQVSKLLSLGSDVVFPVGVNGLAAAQQVATVPGATVIGSGSDWFTEDRYTTVKNLVLASVHKLVSAEVASLVGANLARVSVSSAPSPTDLGSSKSTPTTILGVVNLSRQHSIAYGSDVQGTLDQIARQIAEGSIDVKPFG